MSEIETKGQLIELESKEFEIAQRKAKALIAGTMLPQNFKNVSDVLILNEMSDKLGLPLIMLAQQLYIVKGKPSYSGQLVIAVLNGSNRFDGVMRWEERQKPWGIRAYNEIQGERVYGDWLDDETISSNGWGSNPKWKTMKLQMARYRTASWFGRLYAPDLLMGLYEKDELIETEVVAEVEPDDLNDELTQGLIGKKVDVAEGEVIEDHPAQGTLNLEEAK